jgi:hypothetical protein
MTRGMNLFDVPERNGMTKDPHPPYSPDLPPSDLFLFGHVKQLLGRVEFPDWDSLFDTIA